MASATSRLLYDEETVSAATHTSDSINIEQIHREICATLLVENNVSGDVDVTIETSYDGTTWFTVGTFTTVASASASGQELITIDRCLTKVRTKIVNQTGTADVDVRLHYRN